MRTEHTENKDEWRFNMSFALPKWVPAAIWYATILFIGGVVGYFTHSLNIHADETSAYNAGVQDGTASCNQPTRLQRGTKAFSGWLSDRD